MTTAMGITDIVRSVTGLDNEDLLTNNEILYTYVPMAMKRIQNLVPGWDRTVVNDTTGDVLDDKIVAEWAACFITDAKGLTAYNPESGEALRYHCDLAKELLLDSYGIMQADGTTKLFPSESRARRSYVGGVRLVMRR